MIGPDHILALRANVSLKSILEHCNVTVCFVKMIDLVNKNT